MSRVRTRPRLKQGSGKSLRSREVSHYRQQKEVVLCSISDSDPEDITPLAGKTGERCVSEHTIYCWECWVMIGSWTKLWLDECTSSHSNGLLQHQGQAKRGKLCTISQTRPERHPRHSLIQRAGR